MFVQVRLLLNRSDPFPEKIVRERLREFSLLNSASSLLRGESAGYSLGERGRRGKRSLLKKLRKTFMRGMGWVEFVQVRVLPNVSDPFPEKIVRERLDGAIRLLRGGSCSFSIQLSTGR